ncbi:MAG: hypothetical protein KF774_10580 [Planctomyces sp.]|nr:hypothetical protein [Planctomyces sp.]
MGAGWEGSLGEGRRTISWFKGLRRMRVRYDRSEDIMEAWKSLAMSVITFRLWHHDLAPTS